MAPSAELLAAKQHLAEQHPELALAPLLAAWRRCKAPSLADLIDQVSASVKRPPLEGSAKERHAEFLSLIAQEDPADGERLLGCLFAGETTHHWEGVAQWARRPADPRFTRRALELLQRPPVTNSSAHAAWREVFNLLVSNQDARAVALLRGLDFVTVLGPRHDYFAPFFDSRAKLVAKALGAIKVPELDPADEALVLELLGKQRALTRDLSALEAAVFAAPDDDAPRLVFADALLERGDPRGEFITLQLHRAKRRLTGPERAREFALLGPHREAWLGPLALTRDEAVDLAFFERGFVHTLAVDTQKEHAVKLLVAAPGFSTVRTLVINLRDHAALPEALLRSEPLRHLTGLGGLSVPAFRELLGAKEPWAFQSVITSAPHYDPGEFLEDLALMSSSRALPRLTSLKVSGYLLKPALLASFWGSENAKRLTAFGASQGLYKLRAWVGEIEAHGLDAQLHSFDLGFDFGVTDFAAMLTRGADGRLSELEVWKCPAHELYDAPKVATVANALSVIPPDRLTAFRFMGTLPTDDRRLLEAALQRQTRLSVSELTCEQLSDGRPARGGW